MHTACQVKLLFMPWIEVVQGYIGARKHFAGGVLEAKPVLQQLMV